MRQSVPLSAVLPMMLLGLSLAACGADDQPDPGPGPGAPSPTGGMPSSTDISGVRAAISLNAGSTCGGREGAVPVQVAVSVAPNASVGTMVVTGTGIPFLDGRAFEGRVEGRRMNGEVRDSVNGACPLSRRITFSLDFEPEVSDSKTGFPYPFFGILDVREDASGACAPAVAACTASLHFAPDHHR